MLAQHCTITPALSHLGYLCSVTARHYLNRIASFMIYQWSAAV
jgi:hypothetical protein